MPFSKVVCHRHSRFESHIDLVLHFSQSINETLDKKLCPDFSFILFFVSLQIYLRTNCKKFVKYGPRSSSLLQLPPTLDVLTVEGLLVSGPKCRSYEMIKMKTGSFTSQ